MFFEGRDVIQNEEGVFIPTTIESVNDESGYKVGKENFLEFMFLNRQKERNVFRRWHEADRTQAQKDFALLSWLMNKNNIKIKKFESLGELSEIDNESFQKVVHEQTILTDQREELLLELSKEELVYELRFQLDV